MLTGPSWRRLAKKWLKQPALPSSYHLVATVLPHLVACYILLTGTLYTSCPSSYHAITILSPCHRRPSPSCRLAAVLLSSHHHLVAAAVLPHLGPLIISSPSCHRRRPSPSCRLLYSCRHLIYFLSPSCRLAVPSHTSYLLFAAFLSSCRHLIVLPSRRIPHPVAYQLPSFCRLLSPSTRCHPSAIFSWCNILDHSVCISALLSLCYH